MKKMVKSFNKRASDGCYYRAEPDFFHGRSLHRILKERDNVLRVLPKEIVLSNNMKKALPIVNLRINAVKRDKAICPHCGNRKCLSMRIPTKPAILKKNSNMISHVYVYLCAQKNKLFLVEGNNFNFYKSICPRCMAGSSKIKATKITFIQPYQCRECNKSFFVEGLSRQEIIKESEGNNAIFTEAGKNGYLPFVFSYIYFSILECLFVSTMGGFLIAVDHVKKDDDLTEFKTYLEELRELSKKRYCLKKILPPYDGTCPYCGAENANGFAELRTYRCKTCNLTFLTYKNKNDEESICLSASNIEDDTSDNIVREYYMSSDLEDFISMREKGIDFEKALNMLAKKCLNLPQGIDPKWLEEHDSFFDAMNMMYERDRNHDMESACKENSDSPEMGDGYIFVNGISEKQWRILEKELDNN